MTTALASLPIHGKSSLIVIAVLLVGAWVAYKLIMGFIRFAVMAAVVLLCAAMFIPGVRGKVLSALNKGTAAATTMALNRCTQQGQSQSACQSEQRKVVAQLQHVCYGKSHNWRACHAEIQQANAWLNLPCMKNLRVANDCVDTVVSDLKQGPKS